MSADPLSDELELTLRIRAKALLRKRLKGLRQSLPRSAVEERSARIVERVLALPELRDARRFALFDAIPEKNEVALEALDAALRGRGARLAYPRTDIEAETMSFRFVDALGAMERAPYGYREPVFDAELATELDVIIVPALAIDGSGNRLGYGGGFYDGALPGLAPPALRIAVIFDFQLLADLPAMPHDVPMDVVVTDARVLRPRSETSDAYLRG